MTAPKTLEPLAIKPGKKLTLHGFQDTTLGPFLLELLLHTEALETKKVLTYG